MNRIFKYLEKSIKELYHKDSDIIENQSLNSVVFRLGVYLNSFIKRDIIHKDLYVDYNFRDKDIDYLDLVVHNRITHKDLLVIKLTKDPGEISEDIYSIKLVTCNFNELSKYGILIVLGKNSYNCYKLSPRYYDED